MSIILSHNDMDGYGCTMSAKKYDKDIHCINVGYDLIVDSLITIQEMLKTSKHDKVFVTDLSFGENDAIELYKTVKHNPDVKFVYCDHHPHESEKLVKIFEKLKLFENVKFIHHEQFCATYLFYKYLVKNGMLETTPEYEQIMHLIDVYDTWKDWHEDFVKGLDLNEFFFKFYGDTFLDIMERNGYMITDRIQEIFNRNTERRKELFSRLESQGFIVPVDDETLIFLCDNYMGYMTIDYAQYKYFINGRSGGQLSVRLRNVENPKLFKNELVERLVQHPNILSSGGHDNAFGITTTGINIDNMISIVQFTVEKMYEVRQKLSKEMV